MAWAAACGFTPCPFKGDKCKNNVHGRAFLFAGVVGERLLLTQKHPLVYILGENCPHILFWIFTLVYVQMQVLKEKSAAFPMNLVWKLQEKDRVTQ